MSSVYIPKLSPYNYLFPDANISTKEGVVAWGGDLNPNRVIAAYQKGIFPWFNEGDVPLWWSPDPRAILYPQEIKISRSLKKSIKKFNITFDNDFSSVISMCKDVRIKNQEQTWILDETVKTFNELHRMDLAHSVEVYDEKGVLAGGLYGLCMGKVFCGESMFSVQRDASKVAFVALAKSLEKYDFLIDCQIPNPHLLSLGVKAIKRDKFLKMFYSAIEKPSGFRSWKHLKNSVYM